MFHAMMNSGNIYNAGVLIWGLLHACVCQLRYLFSSLSQRFTELFLWTLMWVRIKNK